MDICGTLLRVRVHKYMPTDITDDITIIEANDDEALPFAIVTNRPYTIVSVALGAQIQLTITNIYGYFLRYLSLRPLQSCKQFAWRRMAWVQHGSHSAAFG